MSSDCQREGGAASAIDQVGLKRYQGAEEFPLQWIRATDSALRDASMTDEIKNFLAESKGKAQAGGVGSPAVKFHRRA